MYSTLKSLMIKKFCCDDRQPTCCFQSTLKNHFGFLTIDLWDWYYYTHFSDWEKNQRVNDLLRLDSEGSTELGLGHWSMLFYESPKENACKNQIIYFYCSCFSAFGIWGIKIAFLNFAFDPETWITMYWFKWYFNI